MSGTNPFRRKVAPSRDLDYAYTTVENDLSKESAVFPAIDTDVPPRSHKSKTVRIISPHSSATDKDPTYRNFSAPSATYERARSSGSESDEDYEDTSLIDPFDVESDDGGDTSEDGEKLRQNTRGNASSLLSEEQIMSMPPNPFRKTLASQTETTKWVRRNEKRDSEPSNPIGGGSRPHYNVEDFKRLLLTGERNTTHAATIPTTRLPDSSSNTDTSSVSRQSIFEPLPESHQDTPRTSHDVSPSDDEQQVPKYRHAVSVRTGDPSGLERYDGQATIGSMPQALSFKNPALSIPISTFGPSILPTHSTPTSNSPRTPTDINKPLPPPPGLQATEKQASATGNTIDNQRDGSQSNHLQSQINRSPSIRSRPAPPVTRRHSQLRPNSLSNSPEQWNSILEEKPRAIESAPVPSSPSSSKLPPPPPPRRHGRNRGMSTSSTSSAISATAAPLASSPIDETVFTASKTRPPVPPKRTPSSSSFKRPSRIATNPNPPSMAPPPVPPPRRRRSSQSSLTPSRPSGEYRLASDDRQRADSGDSITFPPPTTALELSSGEKDVMADLSALQREVDELRSKFID
ncbi:hypothetical protein MMC29_005191 [Sticta canariensis]|nr:hypothetical protein [Sticta canariensis]